jgi:phosphoheptose isomerase
MHFYINYRTLHIIDFVNLIIKAYKNESKVFACGNGGNVASVQNLVLDLNMHPFVSEDKSARKGRKKQIPSNKSM